jgi:2-keto-4-pentenoate hydratase/2-oxohepta-3-ene-1,7-dioic acid hydratase in catechol pathway
MKRLPKVLVVIITPLLLLGLVLVTLVLIGDASYSYTPLFNEQLDTQQGQALSLFAPDTALTFARYRADDAETILLVTAYYDHQVEGIDLNAALQTQLADPITLFNEQGYERLLEVLTQTDARVVVAAEALLPPLLPSNGHIALGGNFPEHGEEVALEQPFLFLKMGDLRPWNQSVAVDDALLDYEGEVGFVLLEDQQAGAPLPPYVGFVVANDFTDRALLMRRLNFLDVESGQGFTEAKSRENYFPMGALLVIPSDWQTFYPALEITLYVDRQLRQRDVLASMTWQPARFLDEIFAHAQRTFVYRSLPVPLLQTPNIIPEGTIILTSTPAGVVFNSPNAQQVMAGITPFVLSFDWGRTTIFEPFIAGAFAADVFLKPGNEVITRVDGIGIIQTSVVP